jgi:hypothetical protein
MCLEYKKTYVLSGDSFVQMDSDACVDISHSLEISPHLSVSREIVLHEIYLLISIYRWRSPDLKVTLIKDPDLGSHRF